MVGRRGLVGDGDGEGRGGTFVLGGWLAGLAGLRGCGVRLRSEVAGVELGCGCGCGCGWWSFGVRMLGLMAVVNGWLMVDDR